MKSSINIVVEKEFKSEQVACDVIGDIANVRIMNGRNWGFLRLFFDQREWCWMVAFVVRQETAPMPYYGRSMSGEWGTERFDLLSPNNAAVMMLADRIISENKNVYDDSIAIEKIRLAIELLDLMEEFVGK